MFFCTICSLIWEPGIKPRDILQLVDHKAVSVLLSDVQIRVQFPGFDTILPYKIQHTILIHQSTWIVMVFILPPNHFVLFDKLMVVDIMIQYKQCIAKVD